MRLRFVLNADAGTLRALDGAAISRHLRAAAAAAGHEVLGLDLVPASGLQEALARSVSGPGEPPDALIVGAGDGTVSAACGLLAGSGILLGILPLGTMNLLARDLGIPLDWRDAAAALMSGTVRRMDVGWLDHGGGPGGGPASRAFVTLSALGLYAHAVADRERQRRRGQSRKALAMLRAAWRTLRRRPILRLTLETAAGRRRVRTASLVVSNNSYRLGFPHLMARDRLDGGRLGLYIARPLSGWGLVRLILRAFLGRPAALPDLHHSEHDALVIHGRHRLLVAHDGEILTLRPPLAYRIQPGALRLLVPADGA